MIQFKNIHKEYSARTLFQDLSFDVKGGELVAIVGLSGVGKSTLIHMLFGAETPDTGSVEIDGFDISELRPSELQLLRRSIGVIFQDFKLLSKKTVFENIAFAMEACGYSDEEIETRVPEMLHKVNMQRSEHKFPHQLSGGERQRVSIARALAHKPSLLVADEPTGNLDPKNAHDVGQVLKKLNEEDGMTIIIATHDKDLVDSLTPRVIRLENGKVKSDEVNGKFFEKK